MSQEQPLSQRVFFDDDNNIAIINGVRVTGELLDAFTKPTPPGHWFRVVRGKDDTVTVEMIDTGVV